MKIALISIYNYSITVHKNSNLIDRVKLIASRALERLLIGNSIYWLVAKVLTDRFSI